MFYKEGVLKDTLLFVIDKHELFALECKYLAIFNSRKCSAKPIISMELVVYGLRRRA